MKRLLGFVRTAVVGGFLLLLPIVLLVLLLQEMLDIVAFLSDPLVTMFGVEEVVGVELALLLSIGALLLVCFSAGVLLKTQIGSRFITFVERSFLDRVPGYTLIKSLTGSFTAVGEAGHFAVAAVNLYGDGTRVLGFIVDEAEDGTFTIFVPNAPTPISGSVYFVPRERVQRLEVPLTPAVNSLMQWGIGSAELLPRP